MIPRLKSYGAKAVQFGVKWNICKALFFSGVAIGMPIGALIATAALVAPDAVRAMLP